MKKKTVFISGSSKGIGFNLAKKFLENEYEVLINGSNLKNLKKASLALDNCNYYLADLTDETKIKSLRDKLIKQKKKIDILICNYGDSDKLKTHIDLNYAYKSNFFSTTNLIFSLKKLFNKKFSNIICFSSICGKYVIPEAPIGYSLAKSSINHFVKLINYHPEFKNIKVNSIALGNVMFKGSLWEKKIKKNQKQTLKFIKKNVPNNKFVTIDDIYTLCSFLINKNNQSLTGSTIVLDNGQNKSF
jgi:3-oxoacyl-[acyl-carrier protein] reductase